MNRIFPLWIIMYMLSVLPAYTQVVNITPVNPSQQKQPGKHYNFIFKVENTSNDTLKIKPNLQLPPSWFTVTKKSTKQLKPLSTVKFFFAIKIPKNELSQKFNIALNILDPTTEEAISNTAQIEVFVEPLYNLIINTVETPDFVLGDQEFTCKFSLKNSGNTIEKIKLNAEHGKLESNSIDIQPGDEHIITVTKKALQPTSDQPTHSYVTLDIFSQNQNKEFKEVAEVMVYPSEIKKEDPFLRYPITATVISNYTSNETVNETSIQYRISGAGSLDLKNRHILKFNLDSPVSKEFQKIGRIRQSKASYEGPKIEALVGDIAVNVSRLTEESRSGLGLRLRWKESISTYEGFYIKPQFFDEFAYEFGSIFRRQPNRNFRLKANWITQISKEGDNNTLFSIQTEHKERKIEMFPEVALSYSGGKLGYATSFSSSASRETWNLNTSFLYANELYSGYYSNSIHYRVSSMYKFTKRFSLNAGTQLNRSNIRFDNLTQAQIPIVKNHNVSLKYNMNRGHTFGLNGIFRSKEDRAEEKSFDYEELAIKFDYGFRYRDLTVNLNTTYGKTTSFLEAELGEDGLLYNAKFKMNLKLSKKSTMTAFASYLYTSRYSTQEAEYWYYGANVNYNISNRLSASASFTNDYILEETYLLKSFFSLAVNYSKKTKLVVSTNLDYAKLPGTNNRQLFSSINFRYIFDTPLYKKYEVGHIKGRLLTKDKEGEKGVSGTIVKLDNKIRITGSDGSYDFSNLKLGSKKLEVDQSKLELGNIIFEKTPITLEVQPNQTITKDFHVIKAGIIRGYVNFIKTKQVSSSKFKLSRPEVIIELKNETQTFTSTSNRKGEFVFTNIKPGMWEISIYDKVLKKDFTIKNNYQKFEIVEGEKKSITFNMSQKKRNIHFNKNKVKIKL